MGSGSLVQLGLLGLVAILAITLGAKAEDLPYAVHMFIFAGAAILAMIFIARDSDKAPADKSGYLDGVVRAGAIVTVFWGVVGFLVGVVIALQLAYPGINPDLEWFNFGRMRPLHTSAVVFAFGGNALIATSFYVVQRTNRTRLAFGNLAWFVFWGYQLFIVLAATGYLLGVTGAREYAEPEWYVDLWLTIVWVAYFLVFFGTLLQRKEPHIYVANWFFLSFILTVAIMPQRIGSSSYLPGSAGARMMPRAIAA